jgi:hypothetical protein
MEGLIAAILGAVGAAIGGFAAAWINAKIAREQREEERRKERLNYARDALHALVKLRGEYEELLGLDVAGYRNYRNIQEYRGVHARIVGESISVVLSVDDDNLRHIAINRLTPHLVPASDTEPDDYKNRNRNGMTDAVILLAKRVDSLMTKGAEHPGLS